MFWLSLFIEWAILSRAAAADHTSRCRRTRRRDARGPILRNGHYLILLLNFKLIFKNSKFAKFLKIYLYTNFLVGCSPCLLLTWMYKESSRCGTWKSPAELQSVAKIYIKGEKVNMIIILLYAMIVYTEVTNHSRISYVQRCRISWDEQLNELQKPR